MTNSKKYKIVGNLIESPTQHGIARAFCACAVSGCPVSLTKSGIQIDDLSRYDSIIGDRGGVDISPEHVEDIGMTIAEFCKLLIGLVDAGGMESYWLGTIRVSFHISGWADIPLNSV